MSDQTQNTVPSTERTKTSGATAPVNSIFGETETTKSVFEHNTAASSGEHEMAATSALGESTGQEEIQVDTTTSDQKIARFEWLRQGCEQLPRRMADIHWDLHFFLVRDAVGRRYVGPRDLLENKELSVLSRFKLNVTSRCAVEDQCETLNLGRIYKSYRALDQDIRSLLNDADQILESVSELAPAETYTKAKSAVVRLRDQAPRFEHAIKELLKVVCMDVEQALRRLKEISSRW